MCFLRLKRCTFSSLWQYSRAAPAISPGRAIIWIKIMFFNWRKKPFPFGFEEWKKRNGSKRKKTTLQKLWMKHDVSACSCGNLNGICFLNSQIYIYYLILYWSKRMWTGLVQLFKKWWCDKLKMWTQNLDAIFVKRKIAWHLKQCQNRWKTNKLSIERHMFDSLHHLDYLKLFELNFRLSFSILRSRIWLIAFSMHFCFHFILFWMDLF